MPSSHKQNTFFSCLLVGAVLSLKTSSPGAEFSLNFSPNDNIKSNIANVHCTTGGGDGVQPGGGGWGGSGGFQYYGCGRGYFIQEVVRDPTLGSYYHVIVGDPNVDQFAMEFYLSGDYNSDSGGNWNNAHNPLGSAISVTGNGTGNPKRVYMNVINNDQVAGFTQEFQKDRQTQKPRIVQDISSGSMQAKFVIDMTNSNYDQNSIVGNITNKVTFSGADQGTGDFDMAKDSQRSSVTAGRYVYNAGGGWSSGGSSGWGGWGGGWGSSSSGGSGGSSNGSYSYVEGGFNVNAVNWETYCIPGQNPDHRCNFNRSGGSGWGGGGGW